MRMVAIVMTAVLATAALPAAKRQAPLLLPVTDADSETMGGSGCESWFQQGDTGYTFMRADTLMLRTAAGRPGLHQCRVAEDRAAAFGENGAALQCAGRRVSIRRTGKTSSYPASDAVDFPALLSVSDGKTSRTLRGRYGIAC